MSARVKAALLAVVVLAASLMSAPVAGARPTCEDAGSLVRCETSGSVSIKTVPESRAPHVGQINPPRTNNRRRGVVWSW